MTLTKFVAKRFQKGRKTFLDVSSLFAGNRLSWQFVLTIHHDGLDHLQGLLGPSNPKYQLDEDLCRRVAVYLKAIVGGHHNELILNLPCTMPLWSRLHIREGGDRIRTRHSFQSMAEGHWDNTFVRVSLTVPQITHTG